MKTKMKLTMLALAATFLLSSDLQAQDGSLDFSFGTNGIVTTTIGTDYDYAEAMCIQPDGKILVAGYYWNGTNDEVALARYNSDGSLDLSFDTDGKVTSAIGLASTALDMSLLSNGKILVAGYAYVGTSYDFLLARYNSDGSLDLTFDTDGIVTTAIGSSLDQAKTMMVQPDGKILLAGYSINGSTNYDFALVRYNSDGSLDLTFDTDGKVTTAIGSANDIAWAISLQPDGKILLAGESNNGTNEDVALVRYNSNGSLDLTFDTDGIVTTVIGSSYEVARAMSLQPDGKILLAGFFDSGTNEDFALIRYNSNGGLDFPFGTNGIATTSITVSDDAFAMSLQPDGKILLAGSSNDMTGAGFDFAMVRYNSDGSLDLGFDTDGIVVTAGGIANEVAAAINIQPDGKILLAGYSFTLGNSNDFALARYNNTITTINNIEPSNPNLLIYPNPFNSTTTIEFGSTMVDAELSIYNIFGQKVKTISNISDATISLNRNELSSGFYVVHLTQNKKVVATSQIVVVD